MPCRPRTVDTELQERLGSSGAVLIEGPKACGKTATAQQHAASSVFVDTGTSVRDALALDPSLVLDGATPRLLDEWQVAPELWNQVRGRVDEGSAPGQFILTGSAVPADDATRHTGAGRFSRLQMRPMSLQESGHSTGAVSLTALLQGDPARSIDPGLSFSTLVDRLCAGGWPGLQDLTVRAAVRANLDYLDQVRRVDVERLDGVARDPDKVGRVIRSLARPKRHLADPSLAVAALGASPSRLRADLETTGLLFESMVVRDLRVLSQPLDGQVRHYRDSSGLEVDCVVETRDGRWGAFEVKLSPAAVEDGARTLLRFAETVDTRRVGEPACLCVVTARGFGYRRADGIDVIPIGALGP